MAKEQEKKKVKKPTALKREAQNEQKHLRNRAHKSRVRTALTQLGTAVKETKSQDEIQKSLNAVNSLVDKGVKRGIYQINKASRMKAKSFSLANEKK